MKETDAGNRWYHCLVPATKADIQKIMAKVSGLEGRLNALIELLTTIGTEIQNLKTSLGDTDIPDAAEAALEKLEALAKTDADAGALVPAA